MTWYEKANSDIYDEVATVMRQYHGPLVDSAVHVDVIIARSEDTPPLVLRGIECAATVRITSTRERALGIGDAIITINGELMPTWSTRQLHAVIDHELTHLELKLDKKTGQPKEDDQGRPVLKLRLHDREFGWFDSVATRWGSDSFEQAQARDLIESATWVQTLLPGFDVAASMVADLAPHVQSVSVEFTGKPKAKRGKRSAAVVPPSLEMAS